MLSLLAHKLHAPKGVEALYVRKGTRLPFFLIGGHHLFENAPLSRSLPTGLTEALHP